jgi:hypothetical protein
MFIDLQCRFHPQETVTVLKSLPSEFLDWDDIIHTCETNNVQDAVIWAYDARGEPQKALEKAVNYQRELSLQYAQALREPSDESRAQIDRVLDSLRTIGRRGVDICLRRSRKSSDDVDVPLEDIWFMFLNSQIKVVQLVSACQVSSSSPELDEETKSRYLSELRSLVQTTFGALVSITSTSVVSFPRLFKRLVNSTTSHYDEFRTILTGMLESYRFDGDMLTMTKQLVEHDLFDTMASLTRQKARGWTLDRGVCIRCRNPLSKRPPGQSPNVSAEADTSEEVSIFQIVMARTGKAYHSQCYID